MVSMIYVLEIVIIRIQLNKASGQVATAALQKGRADVRQIVHDLKSTRAGRGAATTTTTTG